MTFSDKLQVTGCLFILAGYWQMARNVREASALLVVGCVVRAAWSFVITPHAVWMGGLEVVLGAMSARTFWVNRREA